MWYFTGGGMVSLFPFLCFVVIFSTSPSPLLLYPYLIMIRYCGLLIDWFATTRARKRFQWLISKFTMVIPPRSSSNQTGSHSVLVNMLLLISLLLPFIFILYIYVCLIQRRYTINYTARVASIHYQLRPRRWDTHFSHKKYVYISYHILYYVILI